MNAARYGFSSEKEIDDESANMVDESSKTVVSGSLSEPLSAPSPVSSQAAALFTEYRSSSSAAVATPQSTGAEATMFAGFLKDGYLMASEVSSAMSATVCDAVELQPGR